MYDMLSIGELIRDRTKHHICIKTNTPLKKDNNEMPIFHSVGRCEPVPDVPHATPDSTNASDGSVVTYMCEQGFTFETGFTTSIRCVDTVWQMDSLETECKWVAKKRFKIIFIFV